MSCILDSKFQDSRFHKQNFPGFRIPDSLTWGEEGLTEEKIVKMCYSLLLSAVNYKSPKIRRLSTVSSVVAAAGHVFSTRWHWYWQDENNKWQSYDTPTDGHAFNTTSSQCFEREYMAGKKSPFALIYYNQFLSHMYFKPFVLFGDNFSMPYHR